MDNKAKLERKLVLAREIPEPVFDLSDCNLKTVPSGVYSLCKVLRKEELFLQNNCLSSIDGGGAIEDLSGMKHLNLQSNKLTKLPDAIGAFTNLQVLDVSNNNLLKLPDSIGLLINLQHLHLQNNKLKALPATLCKCQNLTVLDIRGNPQLLRLPAELSRLQRLNKLLLDTTVQFPPLQLHSSSANEVLKFLASETGSTFDSRMEVPHTSAGIAYTDCFIMEERLKELEQQKELQRIQRMALEKSLVEESLKEVEAHQRLKSKQIKLVEDIQKMQSGFDEELSKIQDSKNAERMRLIDDCIQAEERVGNKVASILSSAKINQDKMAQVTEQQAKLERQLLEDLQSKTKEVEKNKILDVMEELVKEETLKAEKWKKYENERNKAAGNWINEESQSSVKLAELASKARENSKQLADALLSDQEIQKAAVASLLEQSDARTWQLTQEVALVEKQLTELTRLEMSKRKFQLDGQIMDLCESRVALTQHLVELFAQKEKRQKDLLSALSRMEKDYYGENYWLEQCQLLIDSSSRQLVQALRCIDPALNQELIVFGVAHCLPLIAGLVQTRDSIEELTDQSLAEAGVEDPDERCLILKAISSFLSCAPSAPLREEDEPTAPPFSPSMEKIFPHVTDECVVCLERPAEVIFTPCGHICCCGVCSGLSSCPLCRSDVINVLRVGSGFGESSS